ncbi:MAG: response regulator [Verrucomicrobia bacterium]|nr:response regulator [Verrucomicrobiota bacterium]
MTRLLVVDDDDAVRGVLKILLERAGYEVLVASNGLKALGVVKAQRVDLVLLDIEMPEMNGFDFCGRLQADPVLKTLPVIMMTGRPTLGVVEKVKAVGARELIPKPFERANLLAKIKGHLQPVGA